MYCRIGQGLDFHQLVSGHQFILGGIKISHNKGIEGHSDGDLLIHSIVDSILGALSLGDIGTHFPSNEKKWKDKDSSYFLEYVIKLAKAKNYSIANIDCTIILQEPHINKYIKMIKINLSKLLNIPLSTISVKATTTDGLGFIGKGEGIGCTSICLLCNNHEEH